MRVGVLLHSSLAKSRQILKTELHPPLASYPADNTLKMFELSLKTRLLNLLKKHYPCWIASGDIQRFVSSKTTFTGRTVARRLGELAQDGLIEADYRQKNHVWYKFKSNNEDKLSSSDVDREKTTTKQDELFEITK